MKQLSSDEFRSALKTPGARLIIKTPNCPKCAALLKSIPEEEDINTFTIDAQADQQARAEVMTLGAASAPFLVKIGSDGKKETSGFTTVSAALEFFQA